MIFSILEFCQDHLFSTIYSTEFDVKSSPVISALRVIGGLYLGLFSGANFAISFMICQFFSLYNILLNIDDIFGGKQNSKDPLYQIIQEHWHIISYLAIFAWMAVLKTVFKIPTRYTLHIYYQIVKTPIKELIKSKIQNRIVAKMLGFIISKTLSFLVLRIYWDASLLLNRIFFSFVASFLLLETTRALRIINTDSIRYDIVEGYRMEQLVIPVQNISMLLLLTLMFVVIQTLREKYFGKRKKTKIESFSSREIYKCQS
ncbi:hypothetical protein ENBRE01_2507 [Enteropsectra breve]|nr:hypothetical protein ENBRE01_2507 [Enteropsectra breve]